MVRQAVLRLSAGGDGELSSARASDGECGNVTLIETEGTCETGAT